MDTEKLFRNIYKKSLYNAKNYKLLGVKNISKSYKL